MTQLASNSGLVSRDTPHMAQIGAASWLVPPRIDQSELLDEGQGTLNDVRTSLNEIWRINQAFASLRSLMTPLKKRLRERHETVRIVDLGTGSGKLALSLRAWARRHNLPIQLYPLDFSARNLSIAQDETQADTGIHLVQANGLLLPFAPNSIDYYISTLFLHPFTPDEVIQMLRDTYRLSRRGIIMNDIVRGYLPLLAFHVTQPIFARHFLTRHDGIVSAKRAYTAAELKEMARAAGLEHARIVTHFPWRMTLIADKPDV